MGEEADDEATRKPLDVDQSSKTTLFNNMKATMMFSVVQKVLMFTLNYLVLSEISPDMLGKVSIRLEFLLSSSLFLAREGVRLACLRHVCGSHSDQDIVNISWMVLPMSLLISGGLSWWFICSDFFATNDVILIMMYIASAALENLVEPVFNICQHHLCVKPRLSAEMLAVLVKSLLCFLCVKYWHLGVLSFGVAQLGYGATYACTLYYHAQKLLPNVTEKFSFSPTSHFLNNGLFRSSLIFSLSSLVKHALTEADKICLSFLSSPHDQGVYAFVSNYASIVARILYFPVEDSIRSSLSRLAAEHSTKGELTSEGKTVVRTLVVETLLLIGILGLSIASFGPSFVKVFAPFLLRSQWSSDLVCEAFALYCIYLFMLGLNGISEACLFAIVREREIWRANIGLMLSSGTFLLCAKLFVDNHGALLVIRANTAAMFVRAVWNLYCIDNLLQLFAINSLSKTNVLFMLLSGLAASLLLNRWGENGREHKLAYLGMVISLGLIFLCTCFALLPKHAKIHFMTCLRRKMVDGKID